MDVGQQLLKGSYAPNGRSADFGLIACSLFEFSSNAPSSYTNGVDVIGARGWTVRDSAFRRIRGPESDRWRAGPAVLFWGGSEDTVVERNLVADSSRGIALGLAPRAGADAFDHRGGVVRDNVVLNMHPWADEGIEANAADGAIIEHNTVLTRNATVPWSIAARFPRRLGHDSQQCDHRGNFRA